MLNTDDVLKYRKFSNQNKCYKIFIIEIFFNDNDSNHELKNLL